MTPNQHPQTRTPISGDAPSKPSGPSPNGYPQPQLPGTQQQHEDSAPLSQSPMYPPPLPRAMGTPVREVRESSVMSSASNSARKPRQNLDERDHLLMVKHCFEQRHNYKEGTKSQFWSGVNQAFQHETGKILAQMSATVGRLVESRRRQISDWENGVISQKPGGELNDKLDQWMTFLKIEDGDAEAERMRQVESRRKNEEARKDARRQMVPGEAGSISQPPVARMVDAPAQAPQFGPSHTPPAQRPPIYSNAPRAQEGPLGHTNGDVDINGYRSQKRKRHDEPQDAHDLQVQPAAWQPQPQSYQYAMQHPPPAPAPSPPQPPRRVVVEGAMTKEDWRDIMGSDARLRALEGKIDKIELMVSQNNKLLLQLVQNQTKDRDRDRDRENSRDRNEDDRVPVHLDAEFERDYLTGKYSKTPLPIS